MIADFRIHMLDEQGAAESSIGGPEVEWGATSEPFLPRQPFFLCAHGLFFQRHGG